MKNREQGKSELAGNRHLRLFFALWPEPAPREALYRLANLQQKECGGRAMRADSTHLTLLFLGETPEKRLPELKRAAAAVHVAGFDFVLEQVSGWRHNGVVYAAPADGPNKLSGLAIRLRSSVAAAGFQFDKRKFTPHVTLLRRVENAPQLQAIAPIHWPVKEFVLVQSVSDESGSHYAILGRWPFDDAKAVPAK